MLVGTNFELLQKSTGHGRLYLGRGTPTWLFLRHHNSQQCSALACTNFLLLHILVAIGLIIPGICNQQPSVPGPQIVGEFLVLYYIPLWHQNIYLESI